MVQLIRESSRWFSHDYNFSPVSRASSSPKPGTRSGLINRRLFAQNENSLFNRMAEFDTNIGLNFVTPHESFDSIDSRQELNLQVLSINQNI